MKRAGGLTGRLLRLRVTGDLGVGIGAVSWILLRGWGTGVVGSASGVVFCTAGAGSGIGGARAGLDGT
jgi:hypothetical protein